MASAAHPRFEVNGFGAMDNGALVRSRARLSRGMTLLEILVVVAVVAMLFGVAVVGSGALTSSRMRADAAMLTGAVKAATARANSTGRPSRLVFDLDEHRVILEQGAGPMLRVKDDDESTGAGAAAVTETEKLAAEAARAMMEGPRAPKAQFVAVTDSGIQTEGSDAGRALSSGVRFRSIQTDHDGEPRTKGRAYLYFWPGGGTERAILQLERDGSETGITVVVSPLTGRSRVETGWVDLTEPEAGDSFGEVEVD